MRSIDPVHGHELSLVIALMAQVVGHLQNMHEKLLEGLQVLPTKLADIHLALRIFPDFAYCKVS